MESIKEIENKNIIIKPVKMKIDKQLDSDTKFKLPDPLPSKSFIWGFFGRAGSGKTTAMINLIQSNHLLVNEKKQRQSYKGLFKNIILCSPSLKSLTDNKEFNKLRHKFEDFNIQTLNAIQEIAEENWNEDNEQTLVIFDDVSSKFKGNKALIEKFSHMAKNHRHMGLSMFILAQKFVDLPHGVRVNMTFMTVFNCSNYKEKEAIFDELPVEKKRIDTVYDYIFNNPNDDKDNSRYNFLFIDASLRKTGKVRIFKKFNELII
jgi:hypothetical protein